MVGTRGNKDELQSGRHFFLSRESRKASRGALEEPQDEIFWDSDEVRDPVAALVPKLLPATNSPAVLMPYKGKKKGKVNPSKSPSTTPANHDKSGPVDQPSPPSCDDTPNSAQMNKLNTTPKMTPQSQEKKNVATLKSAQKKTTERNSTPKSRPYLKSKVRELTTDTKTNYNFIKNKKLKKEILEIKNDDEAGEDTNEQADELKEETKAEAQEEKEEEEQLEEELEEEQLEEELEDEVEPPEEVEEEDNEDFDTEADQMSEEEAGLRRSSRHGGYRRPTWLVGPRRLRGYPSLPTKENEISRFEEDSEEEPSEDEMRYSRRACAERRRSLPSRYQEDTEEEEEISRGPGKPRGTKRRLDKTMQQPALPNTRTRRMPRTKKIIGLKRRRHSLMVLGDGVEEGQGKDGDDDDVDQEKLQEMEHDADEEAEDEDEQEEQKKQKKQKLCVRPMRGRPRQRVVSPEEEEEEEEEDEEEENGSGGDGTDAELGGKRRLRARRSNNSNNSEQQEQQHDAHDSSGEEQPQCNTARATGRPRGRRRPLVCASDKEDLTDEDCDVPMRRPMKNKLLDPVLRHEDCLEYAAKTLGSCSGGKRMRRPVNRFSYSTDGLNGDNKTSSSSSDDDDDDDKGYPLRRSNRQQSRLFQLNRDGRSMHHHKRGPGFIGSPARKPVVNYKRRTTHNKSSTSESSCDNDDERNFEKRRAKSNAKARSTMMPMNLAEEDIQQGVIKDRAKVGSSLADVEPMTVDRSITFKSVGGLANHVRSLREMVVLPLLYPEIFNKFSITPPRGVLFYGPPGTGKTLVARALANECSMGEKKVAFFMRKGADCLSKWVGESERQLRLLFDQAYQMRPSIIFFDEIDGLAPVRSSRQDQIHSSIVSTLLALMDGLDSRGEIIVIGATNRIEAIDPALRRPGRFDRELCFPLPTVKARKQILSVHTSQWQPPPSPRLVHLLAELTTGYCGADLKSLCCEAVLATLRTRYPQVYQSTVKLQLDVDNLKVRMSHFRQAISRIIPAGQRSQASIGACLQNDVKPLLQRQLDSVMGQVAKLFPQGLVPCQRRLVHSSVSWRPRLLLCGEPGQGQSSHLGPALVHALEKVPAHKLDLAALYSTASRTPEEAVTQILHEACSRPPSIVYMPHLDRWFESTPESVRATFLSLLETISPSTPLLLLATSSTPLEQLTGHAAQLFSTYRGEVVNMTNPSKEERQDYFKPLFHSQMIKHQKPTQRRRVPSPLPVAQMVAPRQFSQKEINRLEEAEEATLRELRIFLRQICAKLARNRQFCMFSQPVDIEDVHDYLDIITQPMDLETMMTKIDRHEYICAQDFLKEIDLICANALEYNPNHSAEDQHIRHAACALRDTAYTLIKTEMDSDYEDKCRSIRSSRVKRNTVVTTLVPEFVYTQPLPTNNVTASINGHCSNGSSSSNKSFPLNTQTSNKIRRKRKYNAWAKGCINKPKKKPHLDKSIDSKKSAAEDDAPVEDKPDNLLKDEEDLKYEAMDDSVRDVDSTSTMDMTSAERCAFDLCTEELSNEDSPDGASATPSGAAPLQSTKASSSSTQAAPWRSSSPGAEQPTAAAVTTRRRAALQEDGVVVSSSERYESGSGGVMDYSHLEAAYSNCVSATADASVSQLQQLHAALTRLTRAHARTRDKTQLLQDAEAEIRKFVQFKDHL